uniref:Uncharacterized protein n=1 Tax=Leersia perrieri TaxID=77586 RepID=A0A0D9W6J0_9ORYZ
MNPGPSRPQRQGVGEMPSRYGGGASEQGGGGAGRAFFADAPPVVERGATARTFFPVPGGGGEQQQQQPAAAERAMRHYGGGGGSAEISLGHGHGHGQHHFHQFGVEAKDGQSLMARHNSSPPGFFSSPVMDNGLVHAFYISSAVQCSHPIYICTSVVI